MDDSDSSSGSNSGSSHITLVSAQTMASKEFGCDSGASSITLVGAEEPMTGKDLCARLKALNPVLSSQDVELKQQLLAKEKVFKDKIAAAAAIVPIFPLPPYTKETHRFYMGIYLGNRSVQAAGTHVEEKAYDDWLDTLTRNEYDLLVPPPTQEQAELIDDFAHVQWVDDRERGEQYSAGET